MTIPSRPKYQQQGPASRCIINGRYFGWLNCTPTSVAMGIDKSTLGKKRPSGCSVREATGDTAGGTTLPQCAAVAIAQGVKVSVYTGSNVAAPKFIATQLQAGRGVALQGNTSALLGTTFRSTGTGVNHAVWVNETRGGVLGLPKEALVYDPAADGRVAGWGTADQGPSWWPWSRVLAFAASLRPWGDNDSRLLGAGKMYAGVFPDTEPHAHYKYGGYRPTSPIHQPDRTRILGDNTNVHSTPSSSSTTIRKLNTGDLWEGWQYAKGSEFRGSTLWLGNHDGTAWVHSKRLSYVGGTT